LTSVNARRVDVRDFNVGGNPIGAELRLKETRKILSGRGSRSRRFASPRCPRKFGEDFFELN